MNLKKIKSLALSVLFSSSLIFGTNISNSDAIENSAREGEFYIVSNLDKNKVVDLDTKSSNVTLWDINRGDNQKWNIVYNGDRNAYKIINSHNGKALAWDSNRNNNVIGYYSTDYEDQYWIFDEISEGSYVIRNYKNRDMVLDIYESGTNNRTNIGVFKYHGGKNQSFDLKKEVGVVKSTIQFAGQNLYVDFGNLKDAIARPKSGALTQDLYFVYYPSKGAYKIHSASNPNLILAWNDYYYSNNVFFTNNGDLDEHYWVLEKDGDHSNPKYYLRNYKKNNGYGYLGARNNQGYMNVSIDSKYRGYTELNLSPELTTLN